MRLRLALAAALIVGASAAWSPRHHMGRPMGGMKIKHSNTPIDTQESLASGAVEGYISQKLDHFSNDTRTWTQRYFANLKYFRTGNNVAFLMLGGEGPESMHWVQDETLPYMKWANTYGAAVFDLEHRFYGESRPLPSQTVDELKYLSSRQAIEDIASFIGKMTEKYNLGTSVRWITFGGSYSGALSLWARQKHPELIAGAVGSSGPIQATFDFYKYLRVVEASLGTYDPQCPLNVKAGFNQMKELMQEDAGRVTLSQKFNLMPKLDDLNMTYNDVQNFYATIYGNFQGAVQYSGDNAGAYAHGYGINQVCEIMMQAGDALDNIVAVNVYMNTMYGVNVATDGTDISYQEMIQYLNISDWTTNDPSFDSGARSWTWQTCTEFGYFQSTDSTEGSIFGSVTPNNLYINMCQDVFGPQFNADFISNAVDQTNEYYGGADGYSGSNVVIPNGSLDPWHALGKYTSTDPSVVYFLMNGTAHCADMYPVADVHQPDLDTVHALIKENIKNWINGPINNSTLNVTVPWQRPASLLSPLRSKRSAALMKAPISPAAVNEPAAYPKEFRKIHLGRPPHGFKPAPAGEIAAAPENFETGFFDQIVDHFDNQNPGRFQQKYYKNGQWAKPGGPNFLMIGGEGPESAKWVLNENITYLTWAQEYGATVYLLEHRYYGDSIVGGTKQNPNPEMKYLSSLQMLYDLAEFIKANNYATGNTQPWITFGGSYSGAMSLWMRELFPELVVGAVGSSGPVQAKVDFYEYLEVVEASIRSFSDDCANNIEKAFRLMHTLSLSGEGRKFLSDTFTLDPAWDANTDVSELGMQFFFNNIYGQFQGAVQYSGDNTNMYATGYGIPEMCNYMLNTRQTPLDNVADFNKYMTEGYSGQNFTSTANSYSDMIQYLRIAGTLSPDDGAARYWTWQTCTEFGYFQSSDYGYGIFGSPTPVNLFTQMCIDVFPEMNFSAESLEQSIKATNYMYGGRDKYRGTNVVIPNGSLDPWHALGKYTSNDPSVVWYLINGTAHCADMYPARPEDVPDLAVVRKLISQNIAKWVGAPQYTTATTPTVKPTQTLCPGCTTQSVPPSTNTPPVNPVTPKVTNSAPSTTMLVTAFASILLAFH